MSRSLKNVLALLVATLGLFVAKPALAGWQNTYNFGATLKGDLYTPSKLASPPAILVAIHMCTGMSSVVHGWFDSAADTNGFYIIAPDAGKQCFDASASRDGDKAAIVTMVNAVIKLGGDKTRVFAAGMSSGGCMTNTLLAIYPDVFAGGSAMPGFPAGGWPAGDIKCSKCGSNPPSTDGKYWGDIVRKAYPFSGTYGCSQQWVGGSDEYNFNGWLPAVAAQFVNLSNLGAGMSGTGSLSGWTRTVYKDSAGNVRLETNLGPMGQKHDLENQGAALYGKVISFLGLDKPTGACGIATTSTGQGGASGTGTGSGGASGTGSGGMTSATDGGVDLPVSASGGAGEATGGVRGSGGTVGVSTGGTTSSTGGMSSSSSGGGPVGSGSGGTLGSSSGGTTGSSSGGKNGSGGNASSGGSNGSGGTGNAEHGGSGGCSIAVGEDQGPGRGLALVLMAAVGLVLRRRGSTRR